MADDLKKAHRNGWILSAVAAALVIGFYAFVLICAYHAPKQPWRMGGQDFVPARSEHGEGYYIPPIAPKGGGRP